MATHTTPTHHHHSTTSLPHIHTSGLRSGLAGACHTLPCTHPTVLITHIVPQFPLLYSEQYPWVEWESSLHTPTHCNTMPQHHVSPLSHTHTGYLPAGVPRASINQWAVLLKSLDMVQALLQALLHTFAFTVSPRAAHTHAHHAALARGPTPHVPVAGKTLKPSHHAHTRTPPPLPHFTHTHTTHTPPPAFPVPYQEEKLLNTAHCALTARRHRTTGSHLGWPFPSRIAARTHCHTHGGRCHTRLPHARAGRRWY